MQSNALQDFSASNSDDDDDDDDSVVKLALSWPNPAEPVVNQHPTLYIAIADKFCHHSLHSPLHLLVMGRAKGPGFIQIGPAWGQGILEFDDDGYSRQGLEQAQQFAVDLEPLTGYRLETKDYGSDY